MFTGIIQAEGRIEAIEPIGGDVRMTISTGKLPMADVQLGDSIACNGVCLTAIALTDHSYVADVSNESLEVTTLGKLKVGASVNLEKALRLQDRLGGHLVSGHVDGIGEVVAIEQQSRSWRYQIAAPKEIAKYIATKGSICINGISLTVNDIKGRIFEVNIVPHTRQETTIRLLEVGTQVNLEVDLLARYLERMMSSSAESEAPTGSKITAEFLAENGYK